MQVILCLFFSTNARMSASDWCSDTGRVVLIYTLWVAGIWSSITWRDSRLARGSPPVKTKSQYGVMVSIRRMLAQIFSREKPVMSAYSPLLMQKGQWFLQS